MAVAQVEQPMAQSPKPYRKKSVPSTAFIMDFVRMCFAEDLCEVDFTQSLKSMGYLEALEEKRKNELTAAMKRLNVDFDRWQQDRQGYQNTHPELCEWICSMELKAKKVEALYTQVYVGLRRWTLINEMRLSPFSKQNCISMLNILYPPTYGSIPTSQLTDNTLNAQRNAYFRYIQAVEKSGKDVLINLEQASRRSGETNGWSVVRDIVDVYLIKAKTLIDDCRSAKSAKDFEIVNKEKRADSGVSFTSTISNLSTPEKNPVVGLRPTPITRPSTSTCNSIPLSESSDINITPIERKGSNKFERFTRRLKSRSADTRSQSPPQLEKRPSLNDRQNSLRKMKSTGGLNREFSKHGKHSRENSSDRGGLPQFIIDDSQRERLIREAQQDKVNNPIKREPSPSQYVYRPKTRDPQFAVPEEVSPTSCRITRLDQHPYQDPYRLPNLALPSLKV